MSVIYVKKLFSRINDRDEWEFRKNIKLGLRRFNLMFLLFFIITVLYFDDSLLTVQAIVGTIGIICNLIYEFYCRFFDLAMEIESDNR